jgi:predicted Zn-dependent peptidase
MKRLMLVFLAVLGLTAQSLPKLDVQEARLSNGAKVLLVERRGSGMLLASLFFPGGAADEPWPGSTELLGRCLFSRSFSDDLEGPAKELEALLKQDEGLNEALRLERSRARRDPGTASAQRIEELESTIQALRQKLKARLSPTDVYEEKGFQRQEAVVTRDFLAELVELPKEHFDLWCRSESARLKRMVLSRFPIERDHLLNELRDGAYPRDPGVALLLGAALPGHPYGRDLSDNKALVEALRWSELRGYAQKACSPDRMLIVLVGDLSMESALGSLEKQLGTLPVAAPLDEPILPEISPSLGERRVQRLGAEPRILVGWRIPPRTQRDFQALRLIAQVLAGSRGARLNRRVVEQRGLARDIAASTGRPGFRFLNLFLIEARLAESHSLAELEEALHSEMLRLQQEPISQEEWQTAQNQLELAYLQSLEDPRTLSLSLGSSWASLGDWRAFSSEPQRLRGVGPEALQQAARTHFSTSRRTIALVERDERTVMDPLDAQIIEVLESIAAKKLEDPAQREALVAEGLRQLRMLPQAERENTLKLLKTQVQGKPK